MLEAYLLTLIGVAAAQASPGPNLMAVAAAALGRGRGAGLWTTAGVASGMLVWAVGVAYGLGALFTRYPVSLLALKVLGGGYLLWMGQEALRAVWRGGSDGAIHVPAGAAPRDALSDWRRGLFVVLTNPKAALMWASVATFLFGAGLTTPQVAGFGPVGAISGLTIYGAYALLFSTQAVGTFYRRFTRAIEAVFGLAFGALCGALLLDGWRSVRG